MKPNSFRRPQATRRDLAESLRPDCVTVHLGDAEDGDYDVVIDPSESVNDVTATLRGIMSSAQ